MDLAVARAVLLATSTARQVQALSCPGLELATLTRLIKHVHIASEASKRLAVSYRHGHGSGRCVPCPFGVSESFAAQVGRGVTTCTDGVARGSKTGSVAVGSQHVSVVSMPGSAVEVLVQEVEHVPRVPGHDAVPRDLALLHRLHHSSAVRHLQQAHSVLHVLRVAARHSGGLQHQYTPEGDAELAQTVSAQPDTDDVREVELPSMCCVAVSAAAVCGAGGGMQVTGSYSKTLAQQQ